MRLDVTGITYTTLRTALRPIKPDRYKMTVSTTNEWKIATMTASTHDTFIRELQKAKVQYHTYQAPANRPQQVILRGLHEGIGDEEIKQALIEDGWECTSVFNMPWKNNDGTSQRSRTFFVSFDNKTDGEIKYIS